MNKGYYIVSIAGYLHDIGKIVTNYLHDHEFFREYAERSRGVSSHRHAWVGSFLLSDYGFPKPVVDIVEKHHERVADKAVGIVQWADRFDASYRAGTARDRGRKLPIEIAAVTGLDVARTLHGIDLDEYLENSLRCLSGIIEDRPRLAALLIDGFYREAAIHLRSDSMGDENISLYAHSKIVAALASLRARYPHSSPALVIIEPATEERAQFMTVDIVEYLAGLPLYVYFGVLGAVSGMLDGLGLDPSFHIVSESLSRFVVILGREHMTTLLDYLRKLATDLDISIHVESHVMEKGMLKRDIKTKVYPEPMVFSSNSQLICDVCHQPIQDRTLMLILRRASKTIRLCERCSLIMYAYKVLAGVQRVLCIKKAENGLLRYPQLGLAVSTCNPFKDDDYIVARRIGFQYRGAEDILAWIPSIDVYLRVFRKEYKYLAGVSLKRLLSKLIEEGKLHEYVSTINILNRYIMYIIDYAGQKTKIHSLEIVDDSAVFEVISPFDINPALSTLLTSKLKEYTLVTIVRRGSPGTTYKRLKYIVRRASSTNKIIVVESLENTLSLHDISVLREFSRILNIPYNMLYKRLVKTLDTLTEYTDSLRRGDDVERAYLKSVILSRLVEPTSMTDKSDTEMHNLLPFLGLAGYEESTATGDFREKLSEFLDEESNVRSLVNLVSFLNRIGEVILVE